MTVISILEDPIVDVSDAPILLKPVEYDKEPMNGSNENNRKTTILNTNGCLKKNISLDSRTAWSAAYDIIIPDDFATVPETAVILVSVLSGTAKLVSLTTAMQKPSSAIPIPMK